MFYFSLKPNSFFCQETFWRIPVALNPEKLRRAAEDLDGGGASENGEGKTALRHPSKPTLRVTHTLCYALKVHQGTLLLSLDKITVHRADFSSVFCQVFTIIDMGGEITVKQTRTQSPLICSFSHWNMGRRSMRAKPFGTDGEKVTIFFRPSLDAPRTHQPYP